MPYRSLSLSERVAMLERQLAEARGLASRAEALMAENDRLKETIRELRAELRRVRGQAKQLVAESVEQEVRHLEQEEHWEQAAEVLEHVVDCADSPEVRREALLRLARIQERRLASFEKAKASYERILSEHPFDETARGSLHRVKRKMGR